MRIALPYTRATFLRLWAWWRGEVEAFAPVAALRFSLAQLEPAEETVSRRWLLGEPVKEPQAEQALRKALAALPGVSWATLALHDEDGADEKATLERYSSDADDESQGRRLGTLHLEDPARAELPLQAYLLVLPWEAPPREVREAVLAIRSPALVQQVIRELATIASTEVLEGARATAGIPGPWPGTVPLGDEGNDGDAPPSREDMWLRISDPPNYLLERWLLHHQRDTDTPAQNASQQLRIYWYAPPQAPDQPPLWCLWGYEPALAAHVDLGASAQAAQRMLFLAPQESPRAVPSAAFTSLTERLVVDEAYAPRVRDISGAAPPTIEIPVTIQPRLHEASPRMWLVSEQRLLADATALAGLERMSRRNLTVAACSDRDGAVHYLLSERVQRESPELVDLLATLAEPLAQLKGQPSVYLAGNHHLLPEVRAETLRMLVYRAANAAGMRDAFEADEVQRTQLDELSRETELPLAIITREHAVTGAMMAPAAVTPTTPAWRPEKPQPGAEADPWGNVAGNVEDNGASTRTESAPPPQPRMPHDESNARWCVYFIPATAFHPFDKLVEALRRSEAPRIQQWQRHTPIVLPLDPTP